MLRKIQGKPILSLLMTASISGISIIPTTQYQQTAAQLKDSSIKPGNPKPVVVNGTNGL